jgi:hypothetical protein
MRITTSSKLLLAGCVVAAIAAAACSSDPGPDNDFASVSSIEKTGATSQAVSSTPTYLTSKTPIPFLGKNNNRAREFTAAYYRAWSAPATLDAFRAEFQFDVASPDTAGAAFYNDGDLGIGRRMRCREFDGRRACYVENYGTFGGSKKTALEDTARSRNILNTVAMVFDPSRGTSAVNFVAYDADGSQQLDAQLDTVGANTSIPFNCINCHGGTMDVETKTLSNAIFLPFDLDSFSFPDFDGYHREDQENELRKLNGQVYEVAKTQGTASVMELIEGWYDGGGVSRAGTRFDGNFTPLAWKSQNGRVDDVYLQVIGPFCRNCHLGTAPDLRTAAGTLPRLPDVACRGDYRMPASEATTTHFWNEHNAVLKILDATDQACGERPIFLPPEKPLTPPDSEGECRYRRKNNGKVSNRDFFDKKHSCTLNSDRDTWHPQCRDQKNETEELGCFPR